MSDYDPTPDPPTFEATALIARRDPVALLLDLVRTVALVVIAIALVVIA